MVVFLMGAGRSGTSFYARCLYTMGAYFGSHITTDYSPLNLAGTYDNRLVKAINRRLMDIIEPVRRKKAGIVNKAYWKLKSRNKSKKWYDYHTAKGTCPPPSLKVSASRLCEQVSRSRERSVAGVSREIPRSARNRHRGGGRQTRL